MREHNINCHFIVHGENLGICKTFNQALRHAQGKYVSIIAADDVWLTDKIMRQVTDMERLDDDVAVLYGEAEQIDENGELLPQKFIEAHVAHRGFGGMPQGDIFNSLAGGNFVPAMSTLVRRECLRRRRLFRRTPML